MDQTTGLSSLTNQAPFSFQHLADEKSRLENKLLSRLTKQDLLERKILISESAPSLHHAQFMLSSKIRSRPSTDELRARNIWKGQKNVSPSLHEVQSSLERKLAVDELEKKLTQRPTVQELLDQNILKNNNNTK